MFSVCPRGGGGSAGGRVGQPGGGVSRGGVGQPGGSAGGWGQPAGWGSAGGAWGQLGGLGSAGGVGVSCRWVGVSHGGSQPGGFGVGVSRGGYPVRTTE